MGWFVTNPFEALGIDPLATIGEITERVRDLSEDADEERRKELRALWESLTLHPRTRIAAAVTTFVPETPAPPGHPPPVTKPPPDAEPEPSLLDKLPLAGLVPALTSGPVRHRPSPSLSVLDDPLLQEQLR